MMDRPRLRPSRPAPSPRASPLCPRSRRRGLHLIRVHDRPRGRAPARPHMPRRKQPRPPRRRLAWRRLATESPWRRSSAADSGGARRRRWTRTIWWTRGAPGTRHGPAREGKAGRRSVRALRSLQRGAWLPWRCRQRQARAGGAAAAVVRRRRGQGGSPWASRRRECGPLQASAPALVMGAAAAAWRQPREPHRVVARPLPCLWGRTGGSGAPAAARADEHPHRAGC